MGLAGFDFQALNRKYLAQPSNDAANYAVSIIPAGPGTAWRCIGAYHLKPTENMRGHNCYIEVLDEAGNRTRQPQIAFTRWIDAAIELRKLDKPNDEPATNIDIYKGDTITLRVADAFPSDSVGNIHTRWSDEGVNAQNAVGHHSFYVVYQLQRRGTVTPPIDPPKPPQPETLEAAWVEIHKLWAIVNEWSAGK